MKLCADLSNFKFIDWNLESVSIQKNYNKKQIKLINIILKDDISKLVEDMHNATEQVLEEHRFDTNNKQLHNLDVNSDMPIDNDFGEDFGHDFDGDGEHIEMFMNANEAPKLLAHKSGLDLLEKIDDIHLNSVADLTSLISQTPSEYSYFNFDKLKMQTLPKHLKQIALHLANITDNGIDSLSSKDQKSATVRNKKVIPKLDFFSTIDRMKFFKITKKAVYLCDRTIEKRSEKPFRLEIERQVEYNARQLFQPYQKPVPVSYF